MNKTFASLAAGMAVLAVALAQCGVAVAADDERTIDLGNGVKLVFRLIPAGSFRQGSPPSEPNRGDDEAAREVTIRQPFYLARTPVTRGQFARFVAATGYKTEAETGTSGGFGLENGALVQKPAYTWRNPGFAQTDDHPAVIITYQDAEAFAKWLSSQLQQAVQLPTEAEWEYALRAGTTTAFYNGDAPEGADQIAWHKGNAGDGTRPVGQKTPNAWGFHDLAGNVWEWCRDWYGPYPEGPATDPLETRSNLSNPARRVLRGGSFLKDPKNARSAARFRSTPGSRNADIGFRVMYRESAAPPVTAGPPPTTPPTTSRPEAAPPMASSKDLAQAPPISEPGGHGADSGQFPEPSPPPSFVPSMLIRGMLCPCILVLVGGGTLLLLFLLWRGNRSPAQDDFPAGVQPGPTAAGGRRPGPKPPRAPRIVQDGFWLEDPIYSPGSVVRYSYQIGHTPHSGEFTIGPGHQGHFVYTGNTPSDIQILEVLAGGGNGPSTGPFDTIESIGTPWVTGTSGPRTTRSSTPPPPPQRTRRSGHPPAY